MLKQSYHIQEEIIEWRRDFHTHPELGFHYISAHVIMALNAIVSRRLDPFNPAVVSIGTMNGGFTQNVIPAHVDISGTLRYTEKKVQQQIHKEIRRAFELAKTLGGDFELKIEIGAPPMLLARRPQPRPGLPSCSRSSGIKQESASGGAEDRLFSENQ